MKAIYTTPKFYKSCSGWYIWSRFNDHQNPISHESLSLPETKGMIVALMETTMDWSSAAIRLLVNGVFIGLMIGLTAKYARLLRYSFSFFMISLIVYFLCYTLKNFDLNLGMALGLFAIFGIIRYRTEPLATEEMTYLFVTIGMAVINALSDKFLSVWELITINGIVLLAIFIGERFMLRSLGDVLPSSSNQANKSRIVIHLPYPEKEVEATIHRQMEIQQKNLGLSTLEYQLVKVDLLQQQVVVHLFI